MMFIVLSCAAPKHTPVWTINPSEKLRGYEFRETTANPTTVNHLYMVDHLLLVIDESLFHNLFENYLSIVMN